MANFIDQIKSIWSEMPRPRRYVMIGALSLVVVGLFWLITTQASTNWKQLGRGLNPEDLQGAVAALEEKKIPVRMREGGVVEVPEENLDQARLIVATAGATSGGVGMELFNESTFGQSAFQEAVNYHRALEGELARTIRSIDSVQTARVHLVIPKKRLFKKDQKPPTASVKIQIKRGIELDRNQISGIRYLVANAIEGLSYKSVTIIDNRGNTLAGAAEDELGEGQSFYSIQQSYERTLERRIVELLEPVVGEQKVRAQVSAQLDFSKVEYTEKTVDPENQVVMNEKRTVENSSTTGDQPKGAPGVASNIPGRGAAGVGKETTNKSLQKEAVSYETNTSLRKTLLPLGRLVRLSVAVAVDGRNDPESGKWVEHSEKKMKQITDLVNKAVGIDAKRGDQLAVVNTRFEIPTVKGTEAPEPLLKPWMRELIKWSVVILVCLILVFGLVRPILKQLQRRAELMPAVAEREQLTPEEAEAEALAAEKLAVGALASGAGTESTSLGESLRLQAVESVRTDTVRAAHIVRTWLLAEE
jgi:flagellar M-ring protein FliF